MQNETKPKSQSTVRARANKVKDFRCKNLIAVIESPTDIRNIGTIIRNVNVLGVEKAYIVSKQKHLPDSWEEMRDRAKINAMSASAIKWTFVKIFKDTESCFDHLEKNNFVSVVTSPYIKGHKNAVLHEHDYTSYKKLAVWFGNLAVWFGNEGSGISETAVKRSALCINIPVHGIIETLNLGTSSGIVLYEITKQRRAYQDNLKKKIAIKKSGK
jgi:tRNA (guanosine-2'-O-)-methyltransferase